jgi:hypothetical protein
MQEEIIKHTKKAYKSMKDPQHSMADKIKEILIEIFIIVFAVTLSIWLHGRSEHKHQQHEVKVFLEDAMEDIKEDTSSIHHSRNELMRDFANLEFIANLSKAQIDSIDKAKGSLGFNKNLSTTKFSNGNYEGFKSSGKIGNIENKTLKKLILKYYQELSPSVLEIERLNHSQFLKILDYMAESASNDWKSTFSNPKFKQLLKIYIDYAKGNANIYQETISTADAILIEIKKEKLHH